MRILHWARTRIAQFRRSDRAAAAVESAFAFAFFASGAIWMTENFAEVAARHKLQSALRAGVQLVLLEKAGPDEMGLIVEQSYGEAPDGFELRVSCVCPFTPSQIEGSIATGDQLDITQQRQSYAPTVVDQDGRWARCDANMCPSSKPIRYLESAVWDTIVKPLNDQRAIVKVGMATRLP